MSMMVDPWFVEFAREIRCQEHQVALAGNLGVTILKPNTGYIGQAHCAEGDLVTLVGVLSRRNLSSHETVERALAIWSMAVRDLRCQICGELMSNEYLIAVTGSLDGQGHVVATCQRCQQRFGIPMFWTYHQGPPDKDEVLDVHEMLSGVGPVELRQLLSDFKLN